MNKLLCNWLVVGVLAAAAIAPSAQAAAPSTPPTAIAQSSLLTEAEAYKLGLALGAADPGPVGSYADDLKGCVKSWNKSWINFLGKSKFNRLVKLAYIGGCMVAKGWQEMGQPGA